MASFLLLLLSPFHTWIIFGKDSTACTFDTFYSPASTVSLEMAIPGLNIGPADIACARIFVSRHNLSTSTNLDCELNCSHYIMDFFKVHAAVPEQASK